MSEREEDQVVSGAYAAGRIGISPQLIRRWVKLGHVKPLGRYGRSVLYRLGDLQNLDEAMRRNPRSSRYDADRFPAGA